MSIAASTNQVKDVLRLKQTLKNNPKDIDALLKLATLLGQLKEPDLEGRRTILNRVLSLDPVNKAARDMLLEMDRAEMGGTQVQVMTPIIPIQGSLTPASVPDRDARPKKTLVFRYSLWLQGLVYLFIAFTPYISWQALVKGDAEVLLVMGAFLLILLIPLWFVTAVVKVSALGIQAARLFGIARWEIPWEELETIKPNTRGVGIKIITKDAKVLEVSSQLHGYPVIVEILRRLRPDLFDGVGSSSSGTKIFQKGFFGKYGLLLLSIIASLIFLATLALVIPAIFVGIVLFFLWKAALYGVHTVRLEENRMSICSLRKNLELTAQHIRDIRMVTRYSRRGVASNLIEVELLGGSKFYLSGFPEGNEMMYGFLKNWWSSYQNP